MKKALDINKKTALMVIAFFVLAALAIGIKALMDTNAFDIMFQNNSYELTPYGGDVLQPIGSEVMQPIGSEVMQPIGSEVMSN